jgi:hypothetical protein
MIKFSSEAVTYSIRSKADYLLFLRAIKIIQGEIGQPVGRNLNKMEFVKK